MRPSRSLLALLALVVAAAAALPSAAVAKLPSTGNPSLVPNAGIGGANLHARIATAKAAWGRGGECSDYSCRYRDSRRYDRGWAEFSYEDGPRGKVSSVRIQLGSHPRTGRWVFRSPLTAFRTDKGVKLGSSLRAVKAAYPSAMAPRGTNNLLMMRDRQGDTTVFEFSPNRLVAISMSDKRPRG